MTFPTISRFEHAFARKKATEGAKSSSKGRPVFRRFMPTPLNAIVQGPSAPKSASIQQHETVEPTGIVQPPTTIEDTEILHASIKAGSVAQIVIAVVAVIG